MNRIPGMTGITLLGVASAALLVYPIEGHAQSGLADQRQLLEALGAAIAEVKRSPFHRFGQTGPGVNPRTVVSAAWPLQADGTALAIESGASSPQEAAHADLDDGPRYAVFAAVLGVAAGDLASFALASDSDGRGLISFFTLSPSVTALATTLAGVSPGASFASSFLGTGLGIGTGLLTLKALEEPLYLAAIIPAAIVYYGVRLGVGLATIKHLERKGRG